MFGYDDPVARRYPALKAAVVHARGLSNGPSPEQLLDVLRSEQREVRSHLEGVALSQLDAIAAWRRAFSAFGVSPTDHRSAVEALLRRLTKRGELPSIDTLDDIGNLTSIRHRVPVAVLDRGGLSGTVTVRLATGDEAFTDIASGQTSHPDPGEVVFVDEAGRACARRWCWRQSAESATDDDTVEALYVIEAHHEGGQRDVTAAAALVEELLARHRPGSVTTTHLLSADRPRIGTEAA